MSRVGEEVGFSDVEVVGIRFVKEDLIMEFGCGGTGVLVGRK